MALAAEPPHSHPALSLKGETPKENLGSIPPSRAFTVPAAAGIVPLPPTFAFATPGCVLVVDEAGRLLDRSPKAARDPELGNIGLGDPVGRVVLERVDVRRMVHDGSPIDALWFSRGEHGVNGGLAEKDVAAMLHRLRNLTSVLLVGLEVGEFKHLASGETHATRILRDSSPNVSPPQSARPPDAERLVETMNGIGHAFGPIGAKTAVDLEIAIRRAMDVSRAKANRRGISLRVVGAREARRSRSGDEPLLTAAFSAIISNAVDASPDRRDIRVNIESGRASVQIDIDDDGPGLLPPPRTELGTPFSSSKRGGLGLGLLVARRAAHLHGAELSISSREGGGTRATFWLPVAEG